MSQDNMVKMECTQCHHISYRTHKNTKKLRERLEMKKHCPHCGKHTLHKETK